MRLLGLKSRDAPRIVTEGANRNRVYRLRLVFKHILLFAFPNGL